MTQKMNEIKLPYIEKSVLVIWTELVCYEKRLSLRLLVSRKQFITVIARVKRTVCHF